MITIGWYLLKVIICSGILYGYYHVALRNKIFHQWNRFYLLASVIIALAFPIIKINLLQQAAEDKGTMIKMLQTINNGDDIVIEYSRYSGLQLNTESFIWLAYLLISSMLLTFFILTLYKIYRLKKKYPSVHMQDILFVSTDAKGTPFSFFKSIFWNNAIDPGSLQGKQIFNHEIVHIREKHSHDKFFINLVLLVFWINPFFWLTRRELNMIHEFIADKKSVRNSDASAFASMLLQTVYPGQTLPLTNNFFHSPLKRRLFMFARNKNPKVSYISRLVALPLIAIIFFAFTIKMKTIHPFNGYSGKRITVVIDAGHGGIDNGAMANNVAEKDIDLAIAKDIQKLNKSENLNIILSRNDDKYIDPRGRTDISQKINADIFISLHTDADLSDNSKSGITIFIPKNGITYLPQSKILGSAIIQSFENNSGLSVTRDLQQREKNIWVVNNNYCPSILIETGFLTNQKDLNYISDPGNQKAIAQNILNGIEAYASQNIEVTIENTMDSHSKDSTRWIMLENSRNHAVIWAKKIVYTTPSGKTEADITKGIIIINSKIVPNNILTRETVLAGSLTIHSGTEQNMINKYGELAKNGVFVLDNATVKDFPPLPTESTSYKDNIKIDTPPVPASHQKSIDPNALIVVDGKKSSKEILKTISPNSIESVNVLKDGNAIKKYGDDGKNGVVEIALKKESSAIPQDSLPDKVFTKTEHAAQFPGGSGEWLKYITPFIEKNGNYLLSDKNSSGTCMVKFIVNVDGSISNVEATNMKGTKLSEVAIDAIRHSPKWLPATQNGHVVAAYALEKITFKLADKPDISEPE